MKYRNPVIKGFYPDPSVCFANGKYYLASSSFNYFPAGPLFESDDLVNWTPIGFAFTRPEQIMLAGTNTNGGMFAPTLRFNNGRFYLVTTNNTTHQNFYVWTDDIYGDWSDPIVVDQDGIDPSLLFDDGRVYFMSNGTDDSGIGGIVQCEIDIATGRKLSESRCIWRGSGGRFLEGPHLYKINGYYYLMAAEGGTEYGHMITYARSESVWGPFTGYLDNPVLTNRNKAPYVIQGIGHGDLIQDKNGGWHILCLGFRQIHPWMTYHHLGREVFLIPVRFGADGWFTAGHDGTCDEYYDIEGDFDQNEKRVFTFENTLWNIDWQYLRTPDPDNYIFGKDSITLKGTDTTLDTMESPTFICMHQRDFNFNMKVRVLADGGEAGISLYYCESEHYDIAVRQTENGFEAVLRLNIGGLKHEQTKAYLGGGAVNISIAADNCGYVFMVNGFMIGSAESKYLSSEVCGGFTGTVIGLYAIGNNTAEFTDLEIKYE